MVEKTTRNERIYTLSKIGGGSLTYRAIQRRYGFKNVKSVFNIINTIRKRNETRIVPTQ